MKYSAVAYLKWQPCNGFGSSSTWMQSMTVALRITKLTEIKVFLPSTIWLYMYMLERLKFLLAACLRKKLFFTSIPPESFT